MPVSIQRTFRMELETADTTRNWTANATIKLASSRVVARAPRRVSRGSSSVESMLVESSLLIGKPRETKNQNSKESLSNQALSTDHGRNTELRKLFRAKSAGGE